MAVTSTFLNGAFGQITAETKKNPSFPFLIAALLTIPMPYAVNGIAVGVFAFVTLVTAKKSNIRFERVLLYPILLYLLMAASYFWTHDPASTLRALSKVLPLLLLPICFMVGPKYTQEQKRTLMRFYAGGIVLFVLFYLVKASLRYLDMHDHAVFFYHQLVTEDVNAIHVSVYVVLAFFAIFTLPNKQLVDKLLLLMLAGFVILLSSKNIIFVFLVLIVFYEVFYFKATQNIKWITLGLLGVLVMTILFSGKIRDRFLVEFRSNQSEGTLNTDFGPSGNVYNVSIKQAWEKQRFEQNDYFPGTAFRVYQFRIFTEMLHEDDIFWTGYGLNASDFRIRQKGIEHNVFLGDAKNDGYQNKNFHNQYVQLFAEVGIFGLLLLLIMVLLNLKNALRTKDFVHIAFAILMISLFLTESFLSRQRGVVFFAVLYCLFNSALEHRTAEKQNKL